MPHGIQVFDSSGNTLLDTSIRTGFLLGSVAISAGNQSGSTSNANLASGTPFYMFVNSLGVEGNQPTVSFSGTNMTWSQTVGGFAGTLYYGIH